MNVRSILVTTAVLVVGVTDGALESRQAARLASLPSAHGSKQSAAADRDLVVMLLLDRTASMHRFTYKFRGSMYRDNDTALPNSSTLKSNELRHLVDHFADAVRTSERFGVSTFSEHVELSLRFTGDRNALKSSGQTQLSVPDDDISRYGPSPIWDAVNRAVEALKPLPGRRSVILVTDGNASGNHLGVDDVARRAAAVGVIINVIGVQPDHDLRQADGSTITVRPTLFLQRLATATGGVFLLHRDSDWIPKQVDELLMQLRGR